MLEDRMVRLRFRRDYPTQPIWVFLGKVKHFSHNWLAVEGKGVLVYQRDTFPPGRRTLKGHTMVEEQWTELAVKLGTVDEEVRTLVFPRDIIANIRVLPDDFDLDTMRLQIKGKRIAIAVENGPSTSIGEMSED